jgi:Inovirus Coat protein B
MRVNVMNSFSRTRRFGVSLVPVALGALGLAPAAFAADESGITTTSAVAVITDGQAKGIVIGLAMLGLVIAFKIVKKVRGAA